MANWLGAVFFAVVGGCVVLVCHALRQAMDRRSVNMAALVHAERSLQSTQDRAKLSLQAAGVVDVWDWDVAGPKQDPAMEAFLEGLLPEDAAVFQAELDRTVAGAEVFAAEYRVAGTDGAVRWHAARGRLLRGEKGEALRLPGASVDITERKQGELRRDSLATLGSRLRDTDDIAAMVFAAAETLGTTLTVSRAGFGTIDLGAETITIERDWNAPGIVSLAGTLHFRDYGSYIEDLKRGALVSFADARTDPRTADRAAALEAISARAVLNMPVTEAGGFVALLYLNDARAREWTPDEVAFAREVADQTWAATERRRAEHQLRDLATTLERRVEERSRELRHSQARFQAYFDASPEYLFLARMTADGRFTYEDVNPAALAVFAGGIGRDRVIGHTLAEFVDAEDAEKVYAIARECRRTGKPAQYEARRPMPSGEIAVLNVVVATMQVPDEDDVFVLFCSRDLTEQRRAEEALRQSQKMEAVGQLTGGLAHDFNNLLTGIGGSLELLQTRVAQGRLKDLDRYITAAQGASKRAAALTHRLLAFSRQQTLEPKPTDANRLVTGMEELLRRTVGPAITVEVVAAGGLWPTLIDPNQLENALLNLCINARDAMPEGGQLTIETGNRWLDERAAKERDVPPGQYVSLNVSDTGTGMPPEVIARAFDPFFTTKPLGQGTGLGLSMIYGFARQSGGQVRIYSELGQGTSVSLYLPRYLGDAGLVEQAPAAAGLTRAQKGQTVLVVDDEPTVRMLVIEVLEELGYAALEAADGAAGLRILGSNKRIDLLVTDVGLPGGMNGRQVADAARLARPGLKVLFITGYAENAVLSHGHLDPGMHVLTKPFAINALAAQMQSIMAST